MCAHKFGQVAVCKVNLLCQMRHEVVTDRTKDFFRKIICIYDVLITVGLKVFLKPSLGFQDCVVLFTIGESKQVASQV